MEETMENVVNSVEETVTEPTVMEAVTKPSTLGKIGIGVGLVALGGVLYAFGKKGFYAIKNKIEKRKETKALAEGKESETKVD